MAIDIDAAANDPLRVKDDEGSVEEQTLKEKIMADQYGRLKDTTSTKVPWGMQIARSKPSGTV